MDIKRKVVATSVGVIALAGLGAGTAIAQSSGDPAPPTTPPTAQPAGPDQDNQDFTPEDEQGQAEVPDNEAGEGNEGAEAPEPANDPEPNHEDPDGVNVDYTPAGEAPEAVPAQG